MNHQGYVKIDSTELLALLIDAENAVRVRKAMDMKAHADKWKAASWWTRQWMETPDERSNYLIKRMCSQLSRIERLRTAAAAGDVFVDTDEYGAIAYWASWK